MKTAGPGQMPPPTVEPTVSRQEALRRRTEYK